MTIAHAPSLGTRVFKRSPNVVFRHVGPDALLVQTRGSVGELDFIYTLSPVAARVWQMLDGAQPLEAIVDAICAEFDVEKDVAAADIAELVSDLSDAALISQEDRS